MSATRRITAVAALAATAVALFAGCAAGRDGKTTRAAGCSRVLTLPTRSRAFGAFPGLGGTEDVVTRARIRSFARLAGRTPVWTYFSNNWVGGIAFPTQAVRTIRATGSIPFIRMMPRSDFDGYRADPTYGLDRIIAGDFDPQLKQWARDARAVGHPLIVEFGTEANGDWFGWNGRYAGGGATTGYGDPNWPDGPERFRDAYRHVVRVMRGAGADNLTWVFHMDANSDPDVAWNAMRWYFPGTRYVDWIGLSAYGAQTPTEDWQSFADVFDHGYAQATALPGRLPIALLEFGVTERAPASRKAQWIGDAFAHLATGTFPRLRAIAWWNERWTEDDGTVSDLRINSSQAALSRFRAGISSRSYAGRLGVHCRS